MSVDRQFGRAAVEDLITLTQYTYNRKSLLHLGWAFIKIPGTWQQFAQAWNGELFSVHFSNIFFSSYKMLSWTNPYIPINTW